MRPHPFQARGVVVVAPHPDDETIGAFGLIRRLQGNGARLRVIVVSDGAASHPGSRAWPPVRLVRERRRETIRAMARVGLPRSGTRFLDMPDGELAADATRLDRVLGRALRHGGTPDLIVGPTPDDAHADHRAVAAALSRVAPCGVRRLGYRVWPAPRPERPGVALRLGAAAIAAKRRALRGYATQTGRITDSATGCTLTWRHLRLFACPMEQFACLA